MGRKKIPGSSTGNGYGTSTRIVEEKEFAKALEQSDLEEAEKYLARRMEQTRQATVYGVRPKRTFRQAATKYLEEATKVDVSDRMPIISDARPIYRCFSLWRLFIWEPCSPLSSIGRIPGRQEPNHQLCSAGSQAHFEPRCWSEWIDEYGMTWLLHAPKIKLLPLTDARDPVSNDDGGAGAPVFRASETPANDGVVQGEHRMPRRRGLRPKVGMGGETFPHMGQQCVQNSRRTGQEPAKAFGCSQSDCAKRSLRKCEESTQSMFLLTRVGPIKKMYGAAWRKARERAGFPQVRVHDLKHTFGRRLRDAGVSFEDRQDLLGPQIGEDYHALFAAGTRQSDRGRQ